MATTAPTLADAPAFDTVAAITCPLTRARAIGVLTRGCGTLRQPWVDLRRAALQEARDRHMTLKAIAEAVGLSPGRIWHLTKPPSRPAGAPMPDLTPEQARLYQQVISADTGQDLRDILDTALADPADKAAVADELGGPGSGQRYLDGGQR